MVRLNIIRCDRCGHEIKDALSIHKLTRLSPDAFRLIDYEICDKCMNAWHRFINNEHTASYDGEFVEYEGTCPHHVPCAGPFGGLVWKIVR